MFNFSGRNNKIKPPVGWFCTPKTPPSCSVTQEMSDELIIARLCVGGYAFCAYTLYSYLAAVARMAVDVERRKQGH